MKNFRLIKSQGKEVVEVVNVEGELDQNTTYYFNLTKNEFMKNDRYDGQLKIERILFSPANLPKYHINRNDCTITLAKDLRCFRNELRLESERFTTDDNLLDSNFKVKMNGYAVASSKYVNEAMEVTMIQNEYEVELLYICIVAFCVKYNLLK